MKIIESKGVQIMRIFISHATKNKEIVLKFAELLESISSEIEKSEKILSKQFLKNWMQVIYLFLFLAESIMKVDFV